MPDTDKDVVLSRHEIEPGKVDVVRDWFQENLGDERAVQSSLNERGVDAESVFIHSTGDGDYLVYFAEAEDVDASLEAFGTSDREVYREARELLEETLVDGVEPEGGDRGELLFHIVVQAARR